MQKIRVVCCGMGAVGSRIARLLLEKEGVEIVGVIDIAKDKVGKDLGEVLELSKKLEALGVKYAMTFLGTGINPGFLMDTLVITLTGVCQKIDKIKAVRVMNAATRRVPFQKKVG